MKTLKGERKSLTWSENPEEALVEVHGGCAHCGASLWMDRRLGKEIRVDCVVCGGENAVCLRRSPENRMAMVHLPWGCSKWARLESSNLDAAGVRGLDLLIRFQSGIAYLYPQAWESFEGLVASESKGKFFNTEVKPKRVYYRLCEVYGCLNGVSLGMTRCNVHRR